MELVFTYKWLIIRNVGCGLKFPLSRVIWKFQVHHNRPCGNKGQSWEPKRKCPKAILTHLQNHVRWSRTLKCSVKPNVTRPSTKCYFNNFLFIRILTPNTLEQENGRTVRLCPSKSRGVHLKLRLGTMWVRFNSIPPTILDLEIIFKLWFFRC
jgi:hypothetical protein